MKFGPINTYLLYTMCNDGTKSNSTGSGTCSWHGGEAVSGGIGNSWITGIIVAIIMVVVAMIIFGIVVLINNAKEKEMERRLQEQERKYLAQIDKQINWKNKKWTIVGFKYVDGTPRFQSKWNNGKMIRNINVSEVMDQLENQQITQQTEQPESKPIKEKPKSKPKTKNLYEISGYTIEICEQSKTVKKRSIIVDLGKEESYIAEANEEISFTKFAVINY